MEEEQNQDGQWSMEQNVEQKIEKTESVNFLSGFLKKVKVICGKKGFLIGAGITLGLLLVLTIFLALPLRATYRKGMESYEQAKEVKLALSQKNIPLLKTKLKEVSGTLKETRAIYQKLRWLKVIPKAKDYYFDGERAFSIAEKGLEAGEIIIEAIEPYQDFLGLTERKEGGGEQTTEDRIDFLVATLGNLEPKLALLEEKVSEIEKLANEIDPYRYPEEIKGKEARSKLVEGKSQLRELALFFREGKPLLEKVDFLLGADEPRKYLVLFQNDGELRPTGGFWTAYGILQIENGKITPLISEDIYNLDSRFNSNIPAPEPIKKYLKNIFYWHLRDMNLSPDFRVSLDEFLPHYEKVAQEKEVDGIIALDTNVLVDILEVLGRIGVPGWGNFHADPDDRCFGCPQVVYQMELLADKPVPGIKTDRKGFMAPIMHSILANAMGAPREKITPLAQAFFKNLSSKHLLFYFPDQKLQGAIEKMGFGGRIKDFDEDYFHLSDTNLGGAKSNLFITQEVKHEYQLSNGKIKKKVTVKYQNNAPASDCNLERGNLCLNGLYRDWFRFYLPKGSKLEKLTGSETEAKTYQELGKSVFEGFYGDKFPLYPKGISKVSIEYILPFSEKDRLKLLIQKQPGKDPVKHSIWVEGEKQKELIVDGDIVTEISLN